MKLLENENEIILKHVAEILGCRRTDRENLIPILQDVQDRLGYLPGLAMEKIAGAMDIPAVDVFGLVTFYNQFRLNPPGEHQFKVCMGTACYMVGGNIAMDSFKRRLSIGEGDTTPDRKFSLERVACVGCCSIAPVVVVDDMIEGKVTPTRVDGILLAFEDNQQKKNDQKEKQHQEGVQDS